MYQYVKSQRTSWLWSTGIWALTGLMIASAGSEAYAQTRLEQAQNETTALAKKVAPAIVGITRGMATGSGFLIKGNWIVTSVDVVGSVDSSVNLVFVRGIRGSAKVVGRDPMSQVALLKLNNAKTLKKRLGDDWRPLAMGDSSKIHVADIVFSVGDPFRSLSSDGIPALSMGVITRLGRVTSGASRYRGLAIETDASINAGSFGGPLLDLQGRVIGVISSGYTTRRWYGIVVPINNFKSVKNLLARGQTPPHGTLGIAVQDTRGLANAKGVGILNVIAGSPAAKGGLKTGDRILSIDGRKVYDADDISAQLSALPSGTRVRLEVARGTAVRFLFLELSPGFARAVETSKAGKPYLGLSLARTPSVGGGLAVNSVKKNSPFKKAGVKTGDIVKQFAGRSLASLQDLREALKGKKPGDKVKVVVSREGWEKELTVVLGGRKATAKKGLTIGVKVRPSAEAKGLQVVSVAKSGPAAKAGVKVGDVLISGLGGKKPVALTSQKALQAFLKTHKSGAKARFLISREGWSRELEIAVLGSAKKKAKKAKKAPKVSMGLRLRTHKDGYLLVHSVAKNGLAAKFGLKAGDRILTVDGQPCKTAKAFHSAIGKKKPGQKVNLRIERGGWSRTIEMVLGAK